METQSASLNKEKSHQKKSPTGIADFTGYVSPRVLIESVTDDGELQLSLDKRTARLWKSVIGNDDPAFVFHWSDLTPSIAIVNEEQPPIPAWAVTAGFQYPLTSENIKAMILHYCQVGVTAGGIVDMFVIAPNTLTESLNISGRISQLQMDPFMLHFANIHGSSIARVYIFVDSKPRITATPVNIIRHPTLAVNDIQALV